MKTTTKLALALLTVFIIGLGVFFSVLAQEEDSVSDVGEEINLDYEIEAEDLEVEEPQLLPDSPFYFLKEWARGIQSFFAFGRLKKLELESKFANERLMELKKLVEEGKVDQKILDKATEKYEKTMEKIQARAEKIKEKSQENKEVESFLDKFTRHQLLHQRVLEKLENQVPPEVFQKIKEARERHLERFGKVMTKLENRKEKIREILERNLERIKGSKYKNFKNLEILRKLEEKLPEETKEAIRKAQENALKRLKGNLEKMSPENQERFKEYLNKIPGDKEEQFEILEDLNSELEDTPKLKEKFTEVREKFLERVQEKIQEKVRKGTCPEIEKPEPGFCSDGRIIIQRDEKGCAESFRCFKTPQKIELPTLPNLPQKPVKKLERVCITLWDPVCGKDGKTYSNACFAETAGVEINYKGKCK